jgi:hypothetical protein
MVRESEGTCIGLRRPAGYRGKNTVTVSVTGLHREATSTRKSHAFLDMPEPVRHNAAFISVGRRLFPRRLLSLQSHRRGLLPRIAARLQDLAISVPAPIPSTNQSSARHFAPPCSRAPALAQSISRIGIAVSRRHARAERSPPGRHHWFQYPERARTPRAQDAVEKMLVEQDREGDHGRADRVREGRESARPCSGACSPG